jgi:hypothetical protein
VSVSVSVCVLGSVVFYLFCYSQVRDMKANLEAFTNSLSYVWQTALSC